MATENQITIVGNLAADPELRYTPNGQAVASIRVAVNRRIRNQQTNDWEDRTDGFFRVNVWREQGENVAESLHKGDRVLVTGRLTERQFEDREGQTRYVTEIEADEVCPSLRWAKATIEKVSRPGGGGAGRPGGGAGAGGGGAWSPPPPSEPPTTDDVPF